MSEERNETKLSSEEVSNIIFNTIREENATGERESRERSVDFVRRHLVSLCIEDLQADPNHAFSEIEVNYLANEFYKVALPEFHGEINLKEQEKEDLTDKLFSYCKFCSNISDRKIKTIEKERKLKENAIGKIALSLYNQKELMLKRVLGNKQFNLFWNVGCVTSNTKALTIEKMLKIDTNEAECDEFQILLPKECAVNNRFINSFLSGFSEEKRNDAVNQYFDHISESKTGFLYKCNIDYKSLDKLTRKNILRIALMAKWNSEMIKKFYEKSGLYFAFRTEYLCIAIEKMILESKGKKDLDDVDVQQVMIKIDQFADSITKEEEDPIRASRPVTKIGLKID